jgi:V/A-type H+/Na+-transporting ATPase subunit I
MIAEMSQVLILGRKRDSLEVARALQDAGVVHIDPLESSELPRAVLQGADAERKAILERQLARTESALAAIGMTDVAPDANKLKSIPDMGSFLEEVGHRVDVLAKEKADLANELATINTSNAVARSLADLAGTLAKSERVAVLGFTLDKPSDAANLATLNVLEAALKAANVAFASGHKSAGNTTAGLLAVKKEDTANARAALSRAGLAEVRLSGKFEGMNFLDASNLMTQRAKTAPEELQGINDGIQRIQREHAGALSAARLELRDEIARFDAVGSSVAGKYGFAMRGWVPNKNKYGLEMALAPLKGQVVYQFEDAPTHHAHHVPVKLENNSAFKPFELLLAMFAPPAYGAFDPTWVLATCFPLFFGFVIGDIGFGCVSLGLAFFLRNMSKAGKNLDLGALGMNVPPKPLGDVATILFWMAGWSIFFGFIFGEIFGTLGEHLHLFFVPGHEETGLIPILIHRVDPKLAGLMMILALIPGILQILGGWALRFFKGREHHDDLHTFEGLGMFFGVLGLVIFSYGFRNPGSPGFINIIALVCAAIFVFSMIMVMRKNAVTGGMMPIEIMSNGGNILSYLRLYAVGLSSAILANLATDLGWSLGMSIGLPGLLIGIVVASLVHLFAITFTIIGHILQPLRLHYAEFFTKFGFYDESGKAYKPFARLVQPVKQ